MLGGDGDGMLASSASVRGGSRTNSSRPVSGFSLAM